MAQNELLKVITSPKASKETVRTLLKSIGHKPAVIRYFVQGFIINRIAAVINQEFYS